MKTMRENKPAGKTVKIPVLKSVELDYNTPYLEEMDALHRDITIHQVKLANLLKQHPLLRYNTEDKLLDTVLTYYGNRYRGKQMPGELEAQLETLKYAIRVDVYGALRNAEWYDILSYLGWRTAAIQVSDSSVILNATEDQLETLKQLQGEATAVQLIDMLTSLYPELGECSE